MPSLLSPTVLAELHQANLITSEECEELYSSRDVVYVQRDKSPEVLTKTADILQRHGFEEDSKLLTGRQTQPLICVPVVCYTVEPSCKGHLKASTIIVSFCSDLSWINSPIPSKLPMDEPRMSALSLLTTFKPGVSCRIASLVGECMQISRVTLTFPGQPQIVSHAYSITLLSEYP